MTKRLLVVLSLMAGTLAFTGGTADAALSRCSAWKILGISGSPGYYRGGRSRCTWGQGQQNVLVYCSGGYFIRGPRVGLNQFSDVYCPVGQFAAGVYEEH